MNNNVKNVSVFEREAILKEKQEVKRIKHMLKGMKQRFKSNPNNFEKNCKIMIKELYNTLDHENEDLIYQAYKAYGEVIDLLKYKSGTDKDIELFLFVLDAFMYQLSLKIDKKFRL